MKRFIQSNAVRFYVDSLIRAQLAGDIDQVVDNKVKRVLFGMRWRAVYAARIRKFIRLGKEIIRGRYWSSRSQVHSSSDPSSGGATGAGAYTGPATVFAQTRQFPASPGGGAGGSGSLAAMSQSMYGDPVDAGIIPGEVVAYRCWSFSPVTGFLYSVYRERFVWLPNEIVEGDVASGYGIHAFKDRLAMGAYGHPSYLSGAVIVSGTVELWGEIVEHEHGYRASRAAILSIDDSPHYDAKTLRKLYGLNKKKRKAK